MTYWPGSSCSPGLANSARICTVPSVGSTVEPAKFSLPASGNSLPSARISFTSGCFMSRARRLANSASDSAKRTQMGSVRVSVVSRLESAFGASRVPIDCCARPVTPAIGASTEA